MKRISDLGIRISGFVLVRFGRLLAVLKIMSRNDKTKSGFPNPKSLTPVLLEQLPQPSYLRGVPGKTGDEQTLRQSIQ